MAKSKQDTTTHVKTGSNRVKTGIFGLDEMMEGGIPRGNIILLSGTCGTGKSTFGMQYIYKGVTEYNEPGVYVSFEEDQTRLTSAMSLYGWNIEEQIKKRKISIISPEISKVDEIRRSISDEVDRIGAKRLVIDSFTLLSMYLKSDFETRRALTKLDRDLKRLDCTTLLISDSKEGSDSFSITGYEEFIVDGVIVLRLTSSSQDKLDSYVRSVFVRKMRGTTHSLTAVPIKFESDGIHTYASAKVF